jgi:hypothetical protein
MEGEKKEGGGSVQTVKDVAAEALNTAAEAATAVVASRAADAAQQMVEGAGPKRPSQTKKHTD